MSSVEPAHDRVTLAPRASLLRRQVRFGPVHWVDLDPAREPSTGPFDVVARIRHAQAPESGVLRLAADGSATVSFSSPVFAPAPGQALVAYRGDAVLCGGPILDSRAD